MNIDNYVIDSNDEKLIVKLNNNDVSLLQVNDSQDSKQTNIDKDYKVQWKESPDPNSYETSRSSMLNPASSFQNTLECKEVDSLTNGLKKQGNSSTESNSQPREPSRKGRASVIRLQAAVDYSSPSTHTDSDFAFSGTTSGDNQSNLSMSNSTWTGPSSNSSFGPENSITDMHYSSTSSEIQESTDFLSSSALDFEEIRNNQDVQRFLTADGQYIYGIKSCSGEFQFFYPSLDDRERHNEKERRRRSRVSGVCKSLRQIVPGLNEKVDKASVFEHTARYLQFLRDKYGTQFDEEYREKCLFGRKESVSSENIINM